MSDLITSQMLSDWRANYGLDKRTPIKAMHWWQDNMDGKAPAGVVAALGLCINEIERLTAERNALRDDNAKLNGWMEEEAQAAGRLQRKLNATEEEIERLTAEHTGQLAELEAISTALGTNEGNSSVDHILSLRAAARTWENEAERRSRRFEQCAAERDEHRRWREKLADDLHDRESQIIELRRQLAEAEQDARRYRWLRGHADGDRWYLYYDDCGLDLLQGDALDAAIDAAMGGGDAG